MTKPSERPFEYLLRKKDGDGNNERKGQKFDEMIVKNWYRARVFVLHFFHDLSITPEEKKHLHVIVDGDSGLMLSVVRQVALTAHFPNYDEDGRRNRTVITVVRSKDKTDMDIVRLLKKEEYLGNLLDYCRYTADGKTEHPDSYIDLELKIETAQPTIDSKKEIEKKVCEQDVISYCDSLHETGTIDTGKAQYADRMYNLGAEIVNLPYADIHSVERYSMAMDVFLFTRMNKPLETLIKEDRWSAEENQAEVLMSLSNIFCSDCFSIRYNSIRPYWETEKKSGKPRMTEKQAWETHYLALSKSEHARWVVEKLIMGYLPLDNRQRLRDEGNIRDKALKKQFRKELKFNWQSPAHIDLCSFSELRRVDPDNMKFDSFLMLGIPHILKKVGEIPNPKA